MPVPVTYAKVDRDVGAYMVRDQLYDVLASFANDHIDTGISMEELLEESKVGEQMQGKGRRRKAYNVQARYEMRTIELPFSESGTVMRCSLSQLRTSLVDRYMMEVKRLELEQPNCRWVPVAGRVFQNNLNRIFDSTPTESVMPRWASASSLMELAMRSGITEDGTPIAPVQSQTILESKPDYQAVLQVVLVDVAHADLVDPMWEETNEVHGPMAQYIKESFLRLLPKWLQKERKLAKEIIAEFYENEQVGTGEFAEVVELHRDVSEDIAVAARDLMEAREGMALGEVAELFGVTYQALGAAIRKLPGGASGETSAQAPA